MTCPSNNPGQQIAFATLEPHTAGSNKAKGQCILRHTAPYRLEDFAEPLSRPVQPAEKYPAFFSDFVSGPASSVAAQPIKKKKAEIALGFSWRSPAPFGTRAQSFHGTHSRGPHWGSRQDSNLHLPNSFDLLSLLHLATGFAGCVYQFRHHSHVLRAGHLAMPCPRGASPILSDRQDMWSGRHDSNVRLLQPKCSALPS